MKVLFAGDFSLLGRMLNCSDPGKIESAIGGAVKELTESVDCAVVNYEGATTLLQKGILKEGPCLKNPHEAMQALKNLGFDVLALANNHVGDYGPQGVMDTVGQCSVAGLKYMGAGKDVASASAPLFLSGDKKVALLNVCEGESLIATGSSAGLSPIDLISLHDRITDLRPAVDYIIVVVHGGVEHYQLPTPEMKRRYRHLINLGADAVIGHHQHCYCGYEVYRGKPVFYGIGNFFFDRKCAREPWNEGFMVALTLEDGIGFDLIPYRQCEAEPKISMLPANAFDDRLATLNGIIEDDTRLAAEFDKLVSGKKPLVTFQPYSNHYLRELYKRGLFPSMLGKKTLAHMMCHIECETHREVLQNAVSSVLK